MPRSVARTLLAGALTLALALLLTACGSGGDDKGGSTADSSTAVRGDNGAGGSRGGVLRVITEEDLDSPLDSGHTYSASTFNLLSGTVRPLFRYTPDNPERSVPDLAAAPADVSADGRTVTVRIRRGVRYSPPVNREVVARDVKYAIERGFNPSVASGYAGVYYGDVIGADRADGGPIAGITTPDDQTIVFRLNRPTGGILAEALVLPLSAPVPPEVARRYDARPVGGYSTYAAHQAATGPYMFDARADGTVQGVGIVPGRRYVLRRNPNWDPATDDRPAYLDGLEWSVGNDPNVAGRQVLDGNGMNLGDTPTAAIIKRAVQQSPDQIFFSPGGGNRYAAINTQVAPFDDADLRKAVIAATDRDQMRLVRGGRLLGDVATHFLYPGVPGFEEAGGLEGTGADFLAAPSGDPEVARKYMVAAGYPDGRYTGDETITIVGDSGDPSDKDAELVDAAVRSLGFRTRLLLVDSNTMYGRYCQSPSARVNICPNIGMSRDFADAQTVLDAAFNGTSISRQDGSNPNISQLDDPAINAAMKRAELVVDPQERAQAWGRIDQMITETGAAIPWLWDNQPVVSSKDVRCANQLWNQGHCDPAFSSLR
ncbi:ABC transporter substrate-binding protein [Conexibacter sp. JD483]|uniref:ABC transporter substrate-binding protein n=1 Tax=unclassified Conexibacter TaxID=2627773 RepID=UPI002716C7B1|nr:MULTISPECIES: ABC transporter substrate-binding protein [unclassified Conexibacter]MDO8184382.1 ABC transporter substrate-binding protein [Conexibacter sp. CPCC 205706]MDO8197688.1 ABC transporter substrate-binding protein [Conexibacter sp. CPCC 205762]MDR9368351.1 ABC transporter substrate-binding protein [Conexibacter sp. JD483]